MTFANNHDIGEKWKWKWEKVKVERVKFEVWKARAMISKGAITLCRYFGEAQALSLYFSWLSFCIIPFDHLMVIPWSSLHLIFVQILQRINSVAERIWWRQQPSRGRMVPPWGVGTSRRSEKQTSQTEIWETNPRFKAEINLRPAECQPEAQRSNSEEASSNPRQFKFTE